MSRSRRHTPIVGITMSESESDDKRLAARRERCFVREHLNSSRASDPEFDLVMYAAHPRSGGHVFAKDGKVYFGNSQLWDIAKTMRK